MMYVESVFGIRWGGADFFDPVEINLDWMKRI
jgi:hypothetical protein